MKYGFIRVCSATPNVFVADCTKNAEEIVTLAKIASMQKSKIIVFPELSITGCTCGDLFFQDKLLKSAITGLENIVEESKEINALIAVGLPVKSEKSIFDCCAFICRGELLCIIPKMSIGVEQQRWFSSAAGIDNKAVYISEKIGTVPFGTNFFIQDEVKDYFCVAAEIAQDAENQIPPSTLHALNGATIIANLNSNPELIGSRERIMTNLQSLSARNKCAYIMSSAGHNESTTAYVYSGENFVYENGQIIARSEPFTDGLLFADIDLEAINHDRITSPSFKKNGKRYDGDYTAIPVNLFENKKEAGFLSKSTKNTSDENIIHYRKVSKSPFVPEEGIEARCREVMEIQSEGLAKRLASINCRNAVIGLSGGLDSTWAFLVTKKAFEKCGLPKKNILCVTMPGFGSTDRTQDNAENLAKNTGADFRRISIKDSVLQHFKDIGHDPDNHNTVYENAQARERTQILMDLANQVNGIVIGTGDLSELALGWCTYNGDHMSMYGVNASIPKTLMRALIKYTAQQERNKNQNLAAVLDDIASTPVSPELLPAQDGKITQQTENIVGPYELHDFFLYYAIRWGFSPKKIFFLAKCAFIYNCPEPVYSTEEIKKWLSVFFKRFFSQQYKRNCSPDGIQVGSVSLAPGSFNMPSDVSSSIWMQEIQELC